MTLLPAISAGMIQYRAQRLALDKAPKARDGRGLKRCQRFRRNGDHMPRPLFEPAQFARAKAHRAAYLPGQFRHDVSLHGQHCVHCGAAEGGAFAQWPAFP
jgi:hypothetical protein